MKISQETQTILKNFTQINKGIVFHPGNKLYSRRESLIADATVPEEFEREVGIFDLNQFLSIIGLYNDPVLDFGEAYLRIAEADGSAETKYGYAPPGVVSGGTIPKKKLQEIPDNVIDFTITEEQWNKLQKALTILSKPEVKIVSDGSVVRIETSDHTKKDTNSFSLVLSADPHGISCNMVYNRDDMPLLKGSYQGIVTPRFTLFKNTSGFDLSYFVGIEPTTSTFGAVARANGR
jgi:hypothetical protein